MNLQKIADPDPRSIMQWRAVRCTQTEAKGLWTWDQWDGFATVPVAAHWSTSRQAYKLEGLYC